MIFRMGIGYRTPVIRLIFACLSHHRHLIVTIACENAFVS